MCPDETTLIRLLTGDLPDARAREAAAHVRECAACGAAFTRLRGTWMALGRWEAAAPASNLRGRILRAAALARTTAPALGAGAFRMRLAAAVLVAVGAGVAAAVALTSGGATVAQVNVGHEEVVEVLGLEALGGQGALTAVFVAEEEQS